ncbi:PilW family protein [Pseudomonas sp. PDNC002]|uniref:PilW family protein n=1 Tax=Pseudomonas sp. PDNC002 TaxID=2811422 RepID=UPI001964D4D9|nr:PilW family protein [Pseudomonas sp. PDNC002]QRY82315.1 PilW family protein [Pseudomonas sp. PDNC002]
MRPSAQHGISLVELLIAMALSLVLLVGVIHVVLASKRSYQSAVALSELQEGGRFALESIGQDLRNAGFIGACSGGLVNASGSASAQYALEKSGVEGFGSGMPTPAWVPSGRVANTDALLLRYATEPALEARAIAGSTLALAAGGAASGAYYLISDQQSCLLVRNTGSATALVADRSLERFLPPATRAYPYRYLIYWIGRGVDGNPGLFVTDNSENSGVAQTSELVSGVAGLSLRYGVAAGDASVVTAYKAAREMSAGEWRTVRTVRVNLLLQSQARGVDEVPTSLVFDGRTLPLDAERRLRRAMGSTTALRNVAP